MTDISTTDTARSGPKPPLWMVYIAALFAGVILLADALGYAPLERVTAKLAIGLIYSAFVLMIGKGKGVSIVAAVIIWLGIIITFIW